MKEKDYSDLAVGDTVLIVYKRENYKHYGKVGIICHIVRGGYFHVKLPDVPSHRLQFAKRSSVRLTDIKSVFPAL